ncbi:hypothetical protein LINGRAHAP2_LOCUS35976 [Linum grandiflorum]
MLKQWYPQFIPEEATMTSLITWIRIEGLPLEYYNDDALFAITGRIGSPIRVDRQTALVARGKFARVCIEIDLSKPLIPEVGVDGEWLKVAYEGIPTICRYCWHAGHTTQSCSLKAVSDDMITDHGNSLDMAVVTDVSNGKDESERGNWMIPKKPPPRRRGNRKTGNQRKEFKKNQFAALGDEEDVNVMDNVEVEERVDKMDTAILDTRVANVVPITSAIETVDLPNQVSKSTIKYQIGGKSDDLSDVMHHGTSPEDDGISRGVDSQGNQSSSTILASGLTTADPKRKDQDDSTSGKHVPEEKDKRSIIHDQPDPKGGSQSKVATPVKALRTGGFVDKGSPEVNRLKHRSRSPNRRQLGLQGSGDGRRSRGSDTRRK